MGGDGINSLEINYYEHLKDCLTKEIEAMIAGARQVLAPPQKAGVVHAQEEIEKDWDFIRNNIKSLANEFSNKVSEDVE